MSRQHRQQQSAQRNGQAQPSDSCTFSTRDIYCSINKPYQPTESIHLIVKFGPNTSEVDCRHFGHQGALGEAILRAIDPRPPTGLLAVTGASTHRDRNTNDVVVLIKVSAPQGTLEQLALRLDPRDQALDLGPFCPLPGSGLPDMQARVRVKGVDKYVAQQYTITGFPPDIMGTAAQTALEKTYGLEEGDIQRANRWNHTADLLVTLRPGTRKLPEERTFPFRDGQQRASTATIRATPNYTKRWEPMVTGAPPPRAHAQAVMQAHRQYCAGRERHIVHNNILWEAYHRAEAERQAAAAAQEAARRQPTDPRPAAATAAPAGVYERRGPSTAPTMAATPTVPCPAPAGPATSNGHMAPTGASAVRQPPTTAQAATLEQTTQAVYDQNARESEEERKRLQQQAMEKRRHDADAAAARRRAAEAEAAAAAAATAAAAAAAAATAAERAKANAASPGPAGETPAGAAAPDASASPHPRPPPAATEQQQQQQQQQQPPAQERETCPSQATATPRRRRSRGAQPREAQPADAGGGSSTGTAPSPAAATAATPTDVGPGPSQPPAPDRGRARERSPAGQSPKEARSPKRSKSQHRTGGRRPLSRPTSPDPPGFTWMSLEDLNAKYNRVQGEDDERFQLRMNNQLRGFAKGRLVSNQNRSRSTSRTPGSAQVSQDTQPDSLQLQLSQNSSNTTPSQATAAAAPLDQQL